MPQRLTPISPDGSELTIEALRQIAPSCITEVKDPQSGAIRQVVNFDVLRTLLGDQTIEAGTEMYSFIWPGKQAARREAATPITETLRPVLEDSVDWDSTENLYIEGDNLSVLKLLQRSYVGKIKMIYIDPPYNTGNDFIYNDDYTIDRATWALQSGERDEEGNQYRKNPDTNGRFHSDWCSMIYSRLLLSRSLLTDDGVIFISIDDNEVHNLRKICDEVFGEKNFVGMLIWKSTPGSNTGDGLKNVTEYILLYARNIFQCKISTLKNVDTEKYVLEDEYVSSRGKFLLNKLDRRMTGVHYSDALFYPIEAPDGSLIYPGGKSTKDGNWNFRWSKKKVEWGIENGFITFKKNSDGEWAVYFKQYLYVDNNNKRIVRSLPRQNLLNITGASSATGTREVMDLFSKKIFDYPKPLSLIKDIVSHIEDPDSIVLDFFSGSGTTAHAVMQLNAEDGGHRKFICVQFDEDTPEDSEARKAGYKTIPDIAKERIRRAATKIKEENPLATNSLDTGFRVFRLDSSNFTDVKRTPAELAQGELDLMLDNVKNDRSGLDLLYGAMLSWGLSLSLPQAVTVVDGCEIYNVDEGALVACFDKAIPTSVIEAIADMDPLRVLLCDSSFASDKEKINTFELLKQHLNWDDKEVLDKVRVL